MQLLGLDGNRGSLRPDPAGEGLPVTRHSPLKYSSTLPIAITVRAFFSVQNALFHCICPAVGCTFGPRGRC